MRPLRYFARRDQGHVSSWRRRLLIAAGSASALPLFAHAQPARRFRVGLLFGSSREAVASEMAAFVARLAELGYIRDANVEIVPRFAGGDPARIPALARDLLDQNVEIVYVPNTQGALALQKLSNSVAIIFHASDPVKAGLVDSLARPGRNATGFTQGPPTIAQKRLQLLKEAFPQIHKVGVLVDRAFPVSDEIALLRDAASKLKIDIQLGDAGSLEQYLGAVTQLKSNRVDAYYVVYTGSSFAARAEIAAAIRSTQLPAIYGVTRFADDGGLLAYSWQTLKVSVLAAEYADRVLRGARPAELPVQEPTVIELVVNLATARAQRLTIAQSVILRADRVIE
jgi:putative tryptophan/tyrosine transport system substrate-binding protein